MDRAIPVKLPTLDVLQDQLRYALQMEARAERRWRDRGKKADGHTLYKRFAAWREKRETIEGQIELRQHRDAEVQRIIDSLS